MEPDKLLDVLRALDREQVDYYLFGGIALGVHGLIRATEDVDVFIRPSSEDIDRLRRALQQVFPNDPTVQEISASDLLGEFPAVRYNSLDGTFSIDIVTRLGEPFRYEDLEGEERWFQGVRVRVVTPVMLYRMKKDTVRPKDRSDAAWLKREFDLRD